MAKPLCAKCGTEHWRFVKCANAPEANERDQELRKVEAQKRNVQIVWSAPAGFHTFQGAPRAMSTDLHVNEFTHPRTKPPEAA